MPPEPVLGEKTGLMGVQISTCCVVLGLISIYIALFLTRSSENATTLSPDFSSELPLPYSEGL